MKAFWKRNLVNRIFIIVSVVILCSFLVSVVSDYSRIRYFGWVGVSDYEKPTGIDERGKTLWDWLELMIIPVVLLGGGFLLNQAERIAQNDIEENRRKNAQELEDRRAKSAQNAANDQASEETFQIYLDRMSTLLIEKNLRETSSLHPARDIARARTITVVRRLDGERKGLLLNFLYEADLINSPLIYTPDGSDENPTKEKRQEAIINLEDADLRKITLKNASLNEVNLSGADMRGANIQNSYFHNAVLKSVNLEEATLLGNYYVEADLSESNLTGVDMKNSIMVSTVLVAAKLTGINLNESDLRNANLERADLFDAKLRSSNLYGANFSHANLQRTDMSGAVLSEVNFKEASIAGGIFRSAELINANFEDCLLLKVDFKSADLTGANLKGIDLNQCIIENTNLTKVRYNSRTNWPDGLNPEDFNAILEENP